MPTRYFVYSSMQLTFRKEMEAKMGKRFRVGHVFVNGARKPFTEILSTADGSRYSDAKVVASGEITAMKYTLPGGV